MNVEARKNLRRGSERARGAPYILGRVRRLARGALLHVKAADEDGAEAGARSKERPLRSGMAERVNLPTDWLKTGY